MTSDLHSTLERLFSDYRAEWSSDLFRSLFVEPPYFSRLLEARPCVLIGGRGTGKTTSLRSLRFDSARESVGIYVRFNKNRVRAFVGAGLGEEDWARVFAHYFNLLACQELCALSAWMGEDHGGATDPSPVAHSLGLGAVDTIAELDSEIRKALIQLQLYVNNPQQIARPVLSIAEQPLQLFVTEIQNAHSTEGVIYCCLDEYENLLKYQQAVVNTYIKHAEPPLSYKVGLRKHGLKTRATTDANDLLSVPDDYYEIDISSEGFEAFATAVVEKRLTLAREEGLEVPERADEFLKKLTIDEEASLLGATRIAKNVRAVVDSECASSTKDWVASLPDSKAYFLEYWAQSEDTDVPSLAKDWEQDPGKWNTRLGNYQYWSLFWLAKGRRGVRIRKYYCGLRTLLGLASGNIRYFLELIDVAISKQIEGDKKRTKPSSPFALSARAQTDAAVTVGSRRLMQIEGKSEHGTQLQRLVLGVGKVFFEFARDPVGRTPEINAFVLGGTPEARERVELLLTEGASHLVFEVTPRTKATSDTELRDDEYRLHPIFCAYFWFSHRRKRRATFSADALLLLETSPKQAIGELVGRQPGGAEEDDDVPQQLSMFSSFYDAEDD